jgi:hypothetical protein
MNDASQLRHRTRPPGRRRLSTSRLCGIDPADFFFGLIFLLGFIGVPVFAQSVSSAHQRAEQPNAGSNPCGVFSDCLGYVHRLPVLIGCVEPMAYLSWSVCR